jgi:magnesium-transporting ATPase (P-type)
MSILVKDPTDGLNKLYVKGADSEILSRLDKEQINPKMQLLIDDFLDQASSKGFRTLLMAMKVVTDAEVRQFQEMCK